jgi:spermidine synthase
VVFDDARHYLMTATEKYDIIASDPLDVFVKGTAALYSMEYFDAVKRHLKPGGMFTLYVPLYESDLATVKSELATFFAAFPYASVWANNRSGAGYDMVFMGQMDPLKINVEEVQARLAGQGYAPVAESLRDIGVYSAVGLFSVYTGGNTDLGEWTKGSILNRDRDLKLMYMAGWGINSNLADTIYRDMLRFRNPQLHPFVGRPESLTQMQNAMAAVTAGAAYTE